MKTIALVAHDRRKRDMIEWAVYNAQLLSEYNIVCTGTTGTLIREAIKQQHPDLNMDIECKNSGPKGGDAQIAAMIAENKIDLLIFLEDDFSANPHQADISMLERQARVHNVFTACNRATADALITSPVFLSDTYVHDEPKYIEFDREAFEANLNKEEN